MITFQPVLSLSVNDTTKPTEFVGKPPDWVNVTESVSALTLFPFHYFLTELVILSEFSHVNVISPPFALMNPELGIKIETKNF